MNNNFIKPVKKVAKKVTKYVDKQVVEPARKTINKVITSVSKATNWVVSIYDGITGNSTSNNGGGCAKKKPTFKKMDVEAKCPEKDEDDINLLDILLNCIDWYGTINDIILAFDSNIKFNGSNVILKHIKSGDLRIGDVKVTISGVRNKVKELTGLATGPKTKISKVFKTSMKHQITGAYKGLGLFATLTRLISDFASGVFDLIFGLITVYRMIAIPIGSLLYDLLRTTGSALLKTVLMPFFGPFAWLITLIIDVGIDIIDWFVDLGKEVTNLVEWILSQSWQTVLNFVKAVKKIS